MDSAPITRSPASRRLKVRMDLNNDLSTFFFFRLGPAERAYAAEEGCKLRGRRIKFYVSLCYNLLTIPSILTDCKNLMLQASPVDGPAKTNNSHAFSS